MNARVSLKDPLEFILKTIDENSKSYGNAILKAALVRENEEIFLYLAEISFLYKSDEALKPELHDYGQVILLKIAYDHNSIKELISKLSSGTVSIDKFNDVKTQGGFDSECYHIGSLNRYAGLYFDWPFRAIRYNFSRNTSLNGVYDPLIKPGSPLFPSLYEAIPTYINSEYQINQNTPVSVIILLPDYKAKIDSLILAENQAKIKVTTREIKLGNLIVKLFCKRQEKNSFQSDDMSLNLDGTIEIIMPFVPDLLHCYILDKETGDAVDSKSFGKWYTDRNDGVEIRTSKETVDGMIAKGENEQIEFKMDLGKIDEFLETIVSFSNSTGGVILVGVHDDRRIIGIDDDLDKIDKRIRSLVANRCEPDISLSVEPIQIDHRTIIAIHVYEGKNKPYVLIGKSAYKRVLKDDYPFSRHDFDNVYSNKNPRGTIPDSSL